MAEAKPAPKLPEGCVGAPDVTADFAHLGRDADVAADHAVLSRRARAER